MVAAGTTVMVTFHDAVRAGPTPPPSPSGPASTVTALPATGAGESRGKSPDLWILVTAAGALLLTGAIGMRRLRHRPNRTVPR